MSTQDDIPAVTNAADGATSSAGAANTPAPNRSPSRSPSRRAARASWVAIGVAVLSAIGIGFVQPRLGVTAHKIRQRDDVFLLPPPKQFRAMTLGYHAAGADLLWAKFLLESGLHSQERRPFPDMTRYADGILALEPDFPTLYRFIDTILLYRPEGAGPEQARIARAYLERGTRERPYDADIWLMYGQFCAFLAPSFLKDEQEIQKWRVDGATAIARAVELGSDAQRSLAATAILSKAGERKATIQHLQRAYAMTDDADAREQIMLKLASLEASSDAADATAVVDREWQVRYGFLSRGMTLLVGPYRSASKCAGPSSYARPNCGRDWTAAVDEKR